MASRVMFALQVLCALLSVPAAAQSIRQDFWVTDGPVYSQLLSGNTLYIGGQFMHVGPVTGGGVPLSAGTGAAVSGFPKVTGTVQAVIPDGAGGWYIGGAFTAVGDSARSNLAHILADNRVAAWNPGADGTVGCLAKGGSAIYVGGGFTMLGEEWRPYFGAIDATSASGASLSP